jgi:hypothetical protein
MPISVDYKACGGIGPYSWSVAGSVLTLTDWTGVSVSTDLGAEATVNPAEGNQTTVTISPSECVGGDCGWTLSISNVQTNGAGYTVTCSGGVAPYTGQMICPDPDACEAAWPTDWTCIDHTFGGFEFSEGVPAGVGWGGVVSLCDCDLTNEVTFRFIDSAGSVCETTLDIGHAFPDTPVCDE